MAALTGCDGRDTANNHQHERKKATGRVAKGNAGIDWFMGICLLFFFFFFLCLLVLLVGLAFLYRCCRKRTDDKLLWVRSSQSYRCHVERHPLPVAFLGWFIVVILALSTRSIGADGG